MHEVFATIEASLLILCGSVVFLEDLVLLAEDFVEDRFDIEDLECDYIYEEAKEKLDIGWHQNLEKVHIDH